MRQLAFLLLLLLPLSLLAQVPTTEWDELMQELLEEQPEDEADEESVEDRIVLLNDLHEHPLNINTATYQQLIALPFLSETAVNGILRYRTFNGPLRTLGELMLIREVSFRERRWLRQCVFAGEDPSVQTRRDSLRRLQDRHEFLARADVPLYQRAGWPWARGIGQRVRYTWQHGRRWDVGLRAENDAGEPRFDGTTPTFDSFGGHVMLHDAGCIQTAIVGDFKVGFGQGLIINNSLRLGKVTNSLWRSTGNLRPHRSTDEVNFLRGAAATVRLNNAWSITAFYSHRKLDASVSKNGTIQSINTTGLHRTETELARKGSLTSQTAAIHGTLNLKLETLNSLTLGLTALFQHYDRYFQQSNALYRRIYPNGYEFGAASFDYGFRSRHLLFGGETALSTVLGTAPGQSSSTSPALATLNKVGWRFSPGTQLAVIQRYYSYSYFTPHANAFSENSRVQNESGVAVLLDAERVGPFILRAFFDYFYHPWPRYTMTKASDGWEALLQTTYQHSRNTSLLLRYRLKSHEKSDRRRLSHLARATFTHTLSPCWTAQATALFTALHTNASEDSGTLLPASNSIGFSLSPRIDYTTPSGRLRAAALCTFFRTDDFDSRLFLYEPSVLQTFGLSQLYGRGQRMALTLRLRADKNDDSSRPVRWVIQSKVGVTHYTDRSSISTGPLLISSPWKADVQLLLQLQLR
ncbi:MAG: helix-hairpin-helix domain-containing protein [Bacteroidaceae bacterium]|nr:helix-hairpin-helix domain-containing protein [Bacteroidaceae bacterium]